MDFLKKHIRSRNSKCLQDNAYNKTIPYSDLKINI